MNWWAFSALWVAADIATILIIAREDVRADDGNIISPGPMWAEMPMRSKAMVYVMGLVVWPLYIVLRAVVAVLELFEGEEA